MYFTADNLAKLKKEREACSGNCQQLVEAFLNYPYTHARAREHAHQGLSRRLKILVRCIEKIYATLPPERMELPSNENLYDASIHLQAFVMNVFGGIDNLAWIWVSEKGVTNSDGSELTNTAIGLRKKNERVRTSFSQAFRDYLGGMDPWFEYLVLFRDALAHRIPLYIPPHIVPPDKELVYKQFEHEINQAATHGNFEEADRLTAEQEKLVFFRPWMTQSSEGRTKAVPFHVQLLADFNTVEEIAQKLLEELRRP